MGKASMSPVLVLKPVPRDLEPVSGRGIFVDVPDEGFNPEPDEVMMLKMSLLALLLSAPAALADLAAKRETTIPAPHHWRDLELVVYYPAADASGTQVFAENPVFQGVTLAADGSAVLPPADGGYPVILMSHGLGGHYRSLAWLAKGLTEEGAIVVAVNHPNSTFGDFDMQAGLQHWTRAEDLTLALDWLLATPDLGPLIDPEAVHVAGFSYGGWTALSLIGVRGDLPGYIDHCAAYGERSSHCADIAKAGGDLAALDAGLWGADHADARVKSVLAIDPGLTFGLGPDAVASVRGDILLVTLGQGEDRLPATDISAAGSNLVGLLPEAEVLELAPARHFSMLPLCKPAGEAILAEEKDDPVCTDPLSADRAVIHAQVLEAAVRFFGL
jgi:predicted dienelactone hydrolase